MTTRVVAEADLSVDQLTAISGTILLTEVTSTTLSVEAIGSSAGPSSPMDATFVMHAVSSAGLTVTPTDSAHPVPAMESGTVRTRTASFDVTCVEASDATVTVTASISTSSDQDSDPDDSNDVRSATVELICATPVAINVHPGSQVNPINMRSRPTVAILTTATGEYGLADPFDALGIRATSVRFGTLETVAGGGGTSEVHGRGHAEDSYERDERTRDGDLDLIMHFRAQGSGLTIGSTEACVLGRWSDGGVDRPFFGCDHVLVVP